VDVGAVGVVGPVVALLIDCGSSRLILRRLKGFYVISLSSKV